MKLITYRGIKQLLVIEDKDSRRLHNTVVMNCIEAQQREDVKSVKLFNKYDEAMEKVDIAGFCHVASVYFEGYEIQYIIEK